jgi:hypothetical protein
MHMGHRSKEWLLRCRLLSGQLEEFPVRNHNKVAFIRQLVAQRLGVALSSVTLLVGDVHLEDSYPIGWYVLRDGDEVSVVLGTH